jgi:hypothetical protein
MYPVPERLCPKVVDTVDKVIVIERGPGHKGRTGARNGQNSGKNNQQDNYHTEHHNFPAKDDSHEPGGFRRYEVASSGDRFNIFPLPLALLNRTVFADQASHMIYLLKDLLITQK